MTIKGTAALLKNITDLLDLAEDYDDHAAAIIVSNEFKQRGHDFSSFEIESTLKTARIFMTDGDIVSNSHSRAQDKVKIFATRVLEDAED